jgi:hypothetical protein
VSAPTNLRGYMDDGALSLDGYGSTVDYLLEQVLELRHPWSVRTFARMRHEPQLAAILRVFLLGMERGNWSIDPAGCRDEVVQHVADDLGLPIKDVDPAPTGARRRRFTWAKHMPVAGSLSMAFGHAPFAQSWFEKGDRWHLDMVQERMPSTIVDLDLNGDGTLKSALQGEALTSGSQTVPITTADHRLVWYAREREGSNYFGQSLFRASYGPWLIKDQMLRVHATSIRKFGMGVPSFEVIPGTTVTPQMEEAAQRVLGNIKASVHSHIVPPPGYRYVLTGMNGSVPDALGFINYLDRQMTRSTLTSILDMATAERGSRSLGETIMQLMIYAQQSEANRLAVDATEQMVIPLVDANWGEDEPAPQIVVTEVGVDDQATAEDIRNLLEFGGLTPDDTLEEDIRKRKSLPPIDHDSRRVETPTAPTTETTQGVPNA